MILVWLITYAHTVGMGVLLATVWVNLAQTSVKIVSPCSPPHVILEGIVLLTRVHSPVLERSFVRALLLGRLPGVHVRRGYPRIP